MTTAEHQTVQKGSSSRTTDPVAFKYYIHDTAAGYSFKMFGRFTESSVSEVACCWQTARTTLKDRGLTLDLRGLTGLDEGAQQWLASMTLEGAKFLPHAFLKEVVAGMPEPTTFHHQRPTWLVRLSHAVRGCA